jgi:hypothetical protein
MILCENGVVDDVWEGGRRDQKVAIAAAQGG